MIAGNTATIFDRVKIQLGQATAFRAAAHGSMRFQLKVDHALVQVIDAAVVVTVWVNVRYRASLRQWAFLTSSAIPVQMTTCPHTRSYGLIRAATGE